MRIKLRTINKALRWIGLILIVVTTDDPEPWTVFHIRRGRYPLRYYRAQS